jgi:steroid delta-isomerase-like uncharacterized protein
MAVLFVTLPACQRAEDVQTEKMLREYCAAWVPSPDIEKILSYFTDDCVYENVPRDQAYRGKNGVRAYVKACYAAIPDFKIEATSVLVSGNRAALEWVMSGTQSGVTTDFPGTGKSFKMRGSSIVELKDGKILRNADYWDMATFLRQIGLMQ